MLDILEMTDTLLLLAASLMLPLDVTRGIIPTDAAVVMPGYSLLELQFFSKSCSGLSQVFARGNPVNGENSPLLILCI